jgi:RecA/RadA recombinase
MAKKTTESTATAKKPTGKKTFSISQMSDMIDSISEKTEVVIERDEQTTFISTGVYILNALISKSILHGGVANDRLTIFAGEPATGKSYIMYNIARNAQKEGYYVFFIDTEHSVNKNVLEQFHIDASPDKLKLVSSNKVEDLKLLDNKPAVSIVTKEAISG